MRCGSTDDTHAHVRHWNLPLQLEPGARISIANDTASCHIRIRVLCRTGIEITLHRCMNSIRVTKDAVYSHCKMNMQIYQICLGGEGSAHKMFARKGSVDAHSRMSVTIIRVSWRLNRRLMPYPIGVEQHSRGV